LVNNNNNNVIITGLSGAGKTQALKILEDNGFYCVDNLPPNLIGGLFSYLLRQEDKQEKNISSLITRSSVSHKLTPSPVAIGLDIRGLLLSGIKMSGISSLSGSSFPATRSMRRRRGDSDREYSKKIASALIENLKSAVEMRKVKIIFLDADTRTLIARYRITRRKHPIPGAVLERSIETERRLLQEVKKNSTAVIDTSNLSPQELKSALLKIVLVKTPAGLSAGRSYDACRRGPGANSLSVKVISFGYRFGLPPECDIVFDVRFLKNPNYEPRLKYLTGVDPRVKRYIFGVRSDRKRTSSSSYLKGKDDYSGRKFLRLLEGFLRFLVPRYIAEGKNYLTIGFGCTGGHHRSVAVAEEIAGKFLKKLGCCAVEVFHRDVDKPLIFAG